MSSFAVFTKPYLKILLKFILGDKHQLNFTVIFFKRLFLALFEWLLFNWVFIIQLVNGDYDHSINVAALNRVENHSNHNHRSGKNFWT